MGLVALVIFVSLALLPTRTALAQTRVRFLHLAPDAGSLEIWIDGTRISESLGYTEPTEYQEITPEIHRVICKTKDEEDPVILNSPFPFRKDNDYTVTVTGKFGAEDLQLDFQIDSCPPSRNLAQLRFTNAVQEQPPADLSIRFGPTLYSDLAFRTDGNCKLLPPDKYPLRLTDLETGDLIGQKQVNFEAGMRYNVFATKKNPESETNFLNLKQHNAPKEVPKVFGIERSVIQLFGAGLIASLLILALGR